MNDILDTVWLYLEKMLNHTVRFLDAVISPMEIFGPGFVIFLLAALVVLFTRMAGKFYVTKRYTVLKKEFEHWQKVREAAMKHPDPEKGKTLAKNVDQAELNRAYYDYFFEGMLKSILTNVLPILLTAAYVTTVYTPENLTARFGDKWVFAISPAGKQIQFSSLFWFVVSLLTCFIFYAIARYIITRKKKQKPVPAKSNA